MPFTDEKGKFNLLHLWWLVPAGAVVLAALFLGIGHLIAWLWRMTVSDIFGVKAVSFWQAWGLLLLCSILFKANVSKNVHRRHKHSRCAKPSGPEQQTVSQH